MVGAEGRVRRMRNEADFLKALAASPGDDLARLAFADWLDERSDPRGPWVRDPEVYKWMGGGAEDPIPPLIKALLGNRNIKFEAVQVLARIGAPAVPALLAAAARAKPRALYLVRSALNEAAAKGAALDHLLRGAADTNRQVRWAALEGLVSLSNEHPAVLAALISALSSPELDGEVGLAILAALGRLDRVSPEAVPCLIELFDRWKGDNNVLSQACVALGKVGPAAAPAIPRLLEALATGLEYWAAPALAGIGVEAVEPLLAVAPQLQPAGRRAAVEALERIGRSAIGALRAAARSGEPDLAAFAEEALASIGPEGTSLADLVEALRYPSPVMRSRALHQLAEMEAAAVEALPAVVDLLLTAEAGDVAFWDVRLALISLGPAAHAELPRIRQALRRPVHDAVWQTAVYLSEEGFGATAALDLLDHALQQGTFPTNQPDSGLRTVAYYSSAYPSLGDAFCLQALLEQLEGPVPADLAEVVRAALGPPAAALAALWQALKTGSLAARLAACLGLRHLGGAETAEALREALADKNRFVRGQAVRALARLGAGVPGVREALTRCRSDRAGEVREAAESALKQIREKQ
jgi:uncharacterized protein (TIGR02996 family)